MNRNRNNLIGAALLLLAWGVAPPGIPAGEPATRDFESGQPLQETLDWIDQYLTVQVLFDPEDLLAIRARVAAMSPDELDEWLARTAPIRRRLESPEWQRTREFLRDFLSKQAMYSDEEIASFRKRAAEMSPEELMELLDRLEAKHASILGMHRASQVERMAELRSRDAVLDAERRQQRAVLDARKDLLALRGQGRSRAATFASGGSRPLFGPTQANAARAAQRYQVPPPLITSREVAAGVVWRSIFGERCWWW